MKNPFAVAQKYLDAPQSETPSPEVVEDKTIQAEKLAASILAENQPDEVGEILRVWKETFGMDLDRARVTKQLQDLREWQSRWRRSI